MMRSLYVVTAALLVVSCTSSETSHVLTHESGGRRPRARAALTGIARKEDAQGRAAEERTATVVVLSVGAADGVEVGYRFTVYRGEEYVGKVEVIKVLNDMSYARVLTDWTRGEIRTNDDASTRVY